MQRFILLFIFSLSISFCFGQKEQLKYFISDYYSKMSNLGDPNNSYDEQKSLKNIILKEFFRSESSRMYNDIRPNGQRYIYAREYLQNLTLDFTNGFKIKYNIKEITLGEKQGFNVIIDQEIRGLNTNKVISDEYIFIVPMNTLDLDVYDGYLESIVPTKELSSYISQEDLERQAELDSLAIVEAEMKSLWDFTININTISSYELFINKYPKSNFSSEARMRIEIIEKARAARIKFIQDSIAQHEIFIKEEKRKEALKRDSIMKIKNEQIKLAPNSPSLVKNLPLEEMMKQLKANMVFVDDGSLQVSANRSVEISAFFIQKYEVTAMEWKMVMGSLPKRFPNPNCYSCPITMISFHEVQTFIRNLNLISSNKYRLPTEEEWEFAALANQEFKYCGSDNVDEAAEYWSNNGIETKRVTNTFANNFGLYGMSGNVAEWCSNWYYSSKLASGKPRKKRKYKSVRGGSYMDKAENVAIRKRGKAFPAEQLPTIGFRLAMDL